MFRFTRKPSSGSHSQYLAKITHSVQCGYMEVVQTMSVLWLWLPDDGFLVNQNMLKQPP